MNQTLILFINIKKGQDFYNKYQRTYNYIEYPPKNQFSTLVVLKFFEKPMVVRFERGVLKEKEKQLETL